MEDASIVKMNLARLRRLLAGETELRRRGTIEQLIREAEAELRGPQLSSEERPRNSVLADRCVK